MKKRRRTSKRKSLHAKEIIGRIDRAIKLLYEDKKRDWKTHEDIEAGMRRLLVYVQDAGKALERSERLRKHGKSCSCSRCTRKDSHIKVTHPSCQGGSFLRALTWLWKNRSSFDKSYVFDYPDYGGLPRDISWNLTPDEVDRIQCRWEGLFDCRCQRDWIDMNDDIEL